MSIFLNALAANPTSALFLVLVLMQPVRSSASLLHEHEMKRSYGQSACNEERNL
jgi:hypothetical protein